MIKDPVLIDEWHVVARSADVGEEQVVTARLLEEELVLWRSNGKLLAWQDLCIHRGARLSRGKVEGNTFTCPYHGWVYNTEGCCVRIPAHPDQTPPAKARVKKYLAQERYGAIWVSLGNPDHDLPDLPEWRDPAYRTIVSGHPIEAHAPRAIENYLDFAHLPFVHGGYLGDPELPEVEDYDVEVSADGIVAPDLRIWQPNPDGTGKGAMVSYTYYVYRPLMAGFVKDTVSSVFAVTPVEEMKSVGWLFGAMKGQEDTPEEDLYAWQNLIISQDIPVVESQRPELLPLDLQAELHLRSDRLAIAYRKWLNELGLTFGVA